MTNNTDWQDYTLRILDVVNRLGVKHYIKADGSIVRKIISAHIARINDMLYRLDEVLKSGEDNAKRMG